MIHRLLRRCCLFFVAGAVIAVAAVPFANAQSPEQLGLKQPTKNQAKNAEDKTRKLRESLDVVISTLEDDAQRHALLAQLKTLREGARKSGQGNPKSNPIVGEGPHGLLGALADSFNDFGQRVAARDTAFDAWLDHARAAQNDFRALYHNASAAELRSNFFQILVGLAVWAALLIALARAGQALFVRRGWPLILPPEPGLLLLIAHFLRRVLPVLLTFAGLLVSARSLDTSTAARAVVLVVAYAALCARTLTSVVDIVVSLFTSGHRRVAVGLLHRMALKPLFAIGVLVALADAMTSGRFGTLLGASLSLWLSETMSLLAAVLSAWLVLRVRRPVQHLLRNRPYAQRRRYTTMRELTVLGASFWYVPVLVVIFASMLAILLSGGGTRAAFARAMVSAVLLVLAFVATGLLRRYRTTKRAHIRENPYLQRLSRVGYTLAHGVIWFVFAESCAHVWGYSLLGFGGPDALPPRIGRSLGAMALTALIAWLFWVVADTALARALDGRRRHGAKTTARTQTVVPMLRNTLLFIIVLIAGIAALANLGVNVTPLLAGAGIIGLALGFGAQNLVQDLITGIFILVEDSIAVGDFLEINGYMGSVEGLNLRTVRLRDLDGVLHFITFSHISSIHNMSRQFGIALLKIRIPHDMPIDDAIALMRDTATELRKGWRMARLVRSPIEMQGIHAFEDGCPILRMRMRTAPEYQWDVARAFNLLLKQLMEERYVSPGAPRISVQMEAGHTAAVGPPESRGDSRRERPTPGGPQPDPS